MNDKNTEATRIETAVKKGRVVVKALRDRADYIERFLDSVDERFSQHAKEERADIANELEQVVRFHGNIVEKQFMVKLDV